MTDPELLQSLDYILNRSNESAIDVLAEAVVRRRRNLSVFNVMGGMPDPQGMAKQITERVNAGIEGGIENMRQSIRKMIVNIIRENAPQLSDKQIDELCEAWLPETGSGKIVQSRVPDDMLLSMIEQFISFSHGTMHESVDQNLREEIGAWPQRYWDVFPPVVQQIISDYLKEKISKADFSSRLKLALGL
ncbi:MAG: hypothetical protein FWC03_08535 [Treponema sp.]|nr:hypothetical protein [Treponema sp.]